MKSSDNRLLRAIRMVFLPFANLLLKHRIAMAPVIEQLKLAYVEAARKNHGKSGKPASINAIATLTGMSRKHISELLQQISSEPGDSDASYTPAASVISAWVTQEEYISGSGQPISLEKGPGPGSLHELVTRVIGDDCADDILEELLKSRSVRVHEDGRVELMERSFSISGDLPRILRGALAPLLTTIDKNWSITPGEGFGQHTATTERLDPHKLLTLRRVSKARIIAFMEDVDDILSNLETDSGEAVRDSSGNEIATVGFGAYYFELDRSPNESHEQ